MPAPLLYEGVTIEPGSRARVDIPIAKLPTGLPASLPVVVLHGARPGPTAWLSGAIHGDELGGVAVVRGLLQVLKPEEIAGTILAVPIVNVFGTQVGSRYLPDGRDLNRSFPGSERGSLAARLAHQFITRVVGHSDFGIDFHTGSGGRANLPQLRCDMENPEVRRLAEAFHPPVIVHSATRTGSLRRAAGKRGIPTLVYEAGEALRLHAEHITPGIDGALRVLKAMGIVEDAPAPSANQPMISTKSQWTRASRSGVCVAMVKLGEHVKAGQTVAIISDAEGLHEIEVHARNAGMVIGIVRTALVYQGDALVHVATIDR